MLQLLISIRVGIFLAFHQLRRASKWTTGLIVFIMMLTFLNLVVVNGILVGLITGSYQQFREYYSGDVLVTPARGRLSIEDSQILLSRIKEQPGIAAVAPRITAQGTILADLTENPPRGQKPNQTSGSIVGINPLNEDSVTNLSSLVIEGEGLKPNEEGYILVGSNRLQQYSSFADVDIPGLELLKNVEVGSKVRLTVVPGGIGSTPATKDVIVKGVVKSKVDQVSAQFFMLDTELRKMLGDSELNFQEIAIRAESGWEETVLEIVKNKTPEPAKVRVQSYEEAIPAFLRDIETTFAIIGNVIGGISLVVASITVFIVIFINAITRRKYIGILKGIGVQGAVIELAYVLQAMFYGILGTAIGSAIVFGFLKPYLDQNPLDFPFSDGILEASAAGTLVRIGILLAITLAAGYVPARMIVKKNTLDSILGR